MTDLNYYSLQDFIDLTSKGRIGPSMFMDLRNLNGNQIHRISYNDHCKYLCDSEKIGLLNLLVMIREKINEDGRFKSEKWGSVDPRCDSGLGCPIWVPGRLTEISCGPVCVIFSKAPWRISPRRSEFLQGAL